MNDWRQNRRLTYWANFWLTVHTAFAAYISSTYLARFVGEGKVGLVYSVSSIFTLVLFVLVVPIFRQFGNLRPAWLLAATGSLATILLAFAPNAIAVVIFFLIFYSISLVLRLNLDLYLESFSNDSQTGGIRGVFLTFANIAWLLSPALAGLILDGERYFLVYLVAAIALWPLIYLFAFRLKEQPFKTSFPLASLRDTVLKIIRPGSEKMLALRRILMVDFLLNFFYVVMVVYMPIYLHNHLGLPWSDIGFVFTIMLLPFLLLEYPLGWLADKFVGEKEILFVGFLIIIATTVAVAFISTPVLWVWALVLFLTRVGAASIEIMKEAYLFKQIDERNDTIVSLTRATIPLSYIIAPAAVSLILLVLPYQYIFLVLAGVMVLGLFPAFRLKDTK